MQGAGQGGGDGLAGGLREQVCDVYFATEEQDLLACFRREPAKDVIQALEAIGFNAAPYNVDDYKRVYRRSCIASRDIVSNGVREVLEAIAEHTARGAKDICLALPFKLLTLGRTGRDDDKRTGVVVSHRGGTTHMIYERTVVERGSRIQLSFTDKSAAAVRKTLGECGFVRREPREGFQETWEITRSRANEMMCDGIEREMERQFPACTGVGTCSAPARE